MLLVDALSPEGFPFPGYLLFYATSTLTELLRPLKFFTSSELDTFGCLLLTGFLSLVCFF